MNFRRFAKGQRRRHTPGVMNRTEAAYAEHLRIRQLAGEVQWFAFESVKLKLAPLTFWTPDFAVLLADDTLELHEVKGGFIEDDAMVKIKCAAEKYPLRVVMAQRKKVKEPWVFTVYGEAKGAA